MEAGDETAGMAGEVTGRGTGRDAGVEAIGLVEFNSIAFGIQAADEMVKIAPVELVIAMTICPGKYLSLVVGDVSSVDSSVRRGVAVGADTVVDSLFIPNVHPMIFPAMMGTAAPGGIASVGVIETFSVASAIIAGDGAAKAAEVRLIDLRVAQGLAGKSYVTMTGDVSDVTAGVRAGVDLIKESGMLVKSVVIPSPHDDLKGKLV
ncbi:MAG: BMC domain-containing protein [bacterium]|jgi:microcompartment protein CcmL/EutN